jgi:NAD(P)-dependent dehydrogenase (short-subunit alcohol dehydrogenase family)
VARDRDRGEEALAGVRSEGGAGDLLQADLSSQASIRAMTDEFQRRYDRLHVLVNCAVVFTSAREISADGLELMFATNHMGYFLLANLLLETIQSSAPASVINVTAPSTVELNFDDLQGERKFSAPMAFGASKMANLLFSFALARRMAGTGVMVNAYHPGLVRSNLMQRAPIPMRLIGGIVNLFGAVPAERAVEGLVALAAAPADGPSGQLVHGRTILEPASYARDEAVQERLWVESMRLAGLTDEANHS